MNFCWNLDSQQSTKVEALRESYGQVSDEAVESRKKAEALQEAVMKADQERQENFITDFRPEQCRSVRMQTPLTGNYQRA